MGMRLLVGSTTTKSNNKSHTEKDDKVTLHAVKGVPLDKRFSFFVPAHSDIIGLSKSLLGHISPSTNIEKVNLYKLMQNQNGKRKARSTNMQPK